MSEEEEVAIIKEAEEATGPLEVKVVKEVEKKEEENMDYIDYDITDEEIKEFENADRT